MKRVIFLWAFAFILASGLVSADEIIVNLGSATTATQHAIGAYHWSCANFTVQGSATYMITTKVEGYSTGVGTFQSLAGIWNNNATRGPNKASQIGSNTSNLSSYVTGSNNWTFPDASVILTNNTQYWVCWYAGSASNIRLGETLGSNQGIWASTTGDNLGALTLDQAGSTNVVKSLNIKIWAYPAGNLTNLSISSPLNNSFILSANSTSSSINLTVTALNAANCYYNASWNTTNQAFGCNSFNIPTTAFGAQNLYVYANDSAGNAFVSNISLNIAKNIYLNNSYETATNLFAAEVWNQTSTPSSIYLNFNGTLYPGSVTDAGGGIYNLTDTLDIPVGSGAVPFNWMFNSISTTQAYDYLNQINFGICNSTLTKPYLNITFKNETPSQEVVNASLATSYFYYNVGDGGVSKTYSLSNSQERANYTFCFSPVTSGVNLSDSVAYYNGVSPQRTSSVNYNLLNSTINQTTLYLLPTSLGIYVTFQVTTSVGQVISGASINISSSTFGSVSSATTDAAGTATFFLNPLTTYTVSIAKTGYTPYTAGITPTQSTYSVQLISTTGGTTINDTTRGITTDLEPSGMYLTNDTLYNFNFTINSGYWTLDKFGFTIANLSGDQYGSASSTSSGGGTLALDLNTGQNNSFIMNAYWVIQGNYTNITKYFVISNMAGSETSLANFRDRIALYLANGGFFGLTPFGVNIIVFLIILGVTGIISYKFGLSSPAAVLLIMFITTMFFDYMNLITYSPSIPFKGGASLLVGLLTLIFGIREAVQ